MLAYNLPLTITLGIVFIYWILALLGTIDFEALDFDFDVEPDAEIDADLDTDIGSGSSNFLVSTLKFVNATDVPLMMVLSFLTLFMWTISILSNSALNPNHSWMIATGLLLINFFVSCLLVKWITLPLLPFFKAFKKGENDDEPVIGRVGKVKSRSIDSQYGQVEVPRELGAPAIVNCRMADGHSPLVRGDQVLVFDKDKDQQLFIVRPVRAIEKQNNQDTNN